MSLKSIDLFAGCGGLSLGLERAGFETAFVNELHPDAMNTYLLNRQDTRLAASANHAFDVMAITQKPGELSALAKRLKNEHGEIGVVAGGPPCQGYSGIGHRRSFSLHKQEIPSNHLYRDHAAFVQAVAPRAFLFENVKGLLTSRWSPDGEKGEIWRDVQATFERIEVKVGRKKMSYRIGAQLIRAADYGVPQNRPRIIMIGIREDIAVPDGMSGVADGLVPDATHSAPGLEEILADLIDPSWTPGGVTLAYPNEALTIAQERMRTDPGGRIALAGDPVSEMEYSKHEQSILDKFRYMIDNDSEIPEHMRTKKFAQRVLPKVWTERGPSITATSLPDDYVHFAQPRTPTVREWARIQTFPDWYRFSGRRTTGGRRRAGDPSIGVWTRDVPKYTQIGNAVPVDLGEALGRHLWKIIA